MCGISVCIYIVCVLFYIYVYIYRLFELFRHTHIITFIETFTPFGLTNGNYIYPYPAPGPSKQWIQFGERVMCFLGMDTSSVSVYKLIRRYIAVYIIELQDLRRGRYVSVYMCDM